MRSGSNDCWILNAERYPDRARVDVRIRDGRIVGIGGYRPGSVDGEVIDARGAALLPGLHDHHLHLFALAAARDSVHCGPPAVTARHALARALRAHPGNGWLRGVAYHESVAGDLDRRQLDALVPHRPVRIQHASGKAWFVNSAGARVLGLEAYSSLEGIERDREGMPTGRLFRLDHWLRERLAVEDPPDLAGVSSELARYGITGVTDTSPGNDDPAAALFARAMGLGALRQRVRLMGSERLSVRSLAERLTPGELKILLDEDRLPDLDELVTRVRSAHEAGRGVAFHCVSRTELVYAVHVLGAARTGRESDVDASVGLGGEGRRNRPSGARLDRIEHASVTPPDLLPWMRALGVTVVTQPGFIVERGDRYLREADPDELPNLYRLRSFIQAGIPLGLSTDAPYGAADPWAAMRAAVSRRTRAGVVVDADEALTPEAALSGFLTRADAPGGPASTIAPGERADLCLLDRPWGDARRSLAADAVRLTLVGGQVVYDRDGRLAG